MVERRVEPHPHALLAGRQSMRVARRVSSAASLLEIVNAPTPPIHWGSMPHA
jgi:hypothetical protein